MEECHSAYWELVPTIDHIIPIAIGGEDNLSNYATTSMLHNSEIDVPLTYADYYFIEALHRYNRMLDGKSPL